MLKPETVGAVHTHTHTQVRLQKDVGIYHASYSLVK